MKDYRAIAFRYLKLNKKRVVITMAGVTITVIALYMILNLAWSYLLHYRQQKRVDADYQIVLFTQSEDQIQQILDDKDVLVSKVGSYYHYDGEEAGYYANALFVDVKNPYNMNAIFDRLTNEYGVEGDINEELAWSYLQGKEEGSVFALIMVLIPFVCYIFAVFGVGIIRNTIQLSLIEQIKDYGDMRCIGATMGQLKTIVYIEGAVMELIGIGIGILIGTAGSYLIGRYLNFSAGMHFIPIIPLIIAFLGDLYFAMEDSCNLLKKMSPLEAIHGEYRLKKEHLKRRRRSVFAILFGVDGDYAYKALMRKPGRFFINVFTITLGVAAFIGIASIHKSLTGIEKLVTNELGYYQQTYQVTTSHTVPPSKVINSMANKKIFELLNQWNEVEEAKNIYATEIFMADPQSYITHLNQERIESTLDGEQILLEAKQELEDMPMIVKGEKLPNAYWRSRFSMTCMGYDEEDYARYEDALLEGTIDLSENGILIYDGSKDLKKDADLYHADETQTIHTRMTNYKVGDTIDIVNVKRFYEILEERSAQCVVPYQKEYDELKEKYYAGEYEENQHKYWEALSDVKGRYQRAHNQLAISIWQQLIDEGDYKSYTVEGVIKDDVNRGNSNNFYESTIKVIVPIDTYCEMTGFSRQQSNGMMFHIKKMPSEQKINKYLELWEKYQPTEGEIDDLTCLMNGLDNSVYLEVMQEFKPFRKGIFYALIPVVFVLLLNSCNIINTTVSNLHLRKKEFAQLRVIGVSKRRLMKIVMMEGVITVLLGNLIGWIIGLGTGYGVYYVFEMISAIPFQIPFFAILCSLGISVLLICGSIYVPMRGLGQNMADDLKTKE